MKFKTFFLEGGNALKNVSRIEQKDIPATLKDLQSKVLDKLKLTKRGDDWHILGSAGKKKESSGDLDIAVNALTLIKDNELETTKDVFPFLEKKIKSLGYDFKPSQGLGVLSFAFPIAGKKDKFIQIDLMITDNMEYTKWAWWSPNETETKFKKMGLYRNFLLFAVTGEVKKDVVSKFDTGEAKEMKKMYLDLTKGLGEKLLSFEGKKGKLTNPNTLDRKMVTNVPTDIVKMIFGKDATLADTNSFESIWKRIHHKNFPYKDKIKDIKKAAKERFEDSGLPIPEELQ